MHAPRPLASQKIDRGLNNAQDHLALPSPSPSDVVKSPTGIIHVLAYTPTEGERGVPITVRIHFHPDLADAMYVRLVVGQKAVATKVRELPGVDYGRWQLDASAPAFDRDQNLSSKVLISVQALNDDNAILDSVVFGEFSYWTPDHPMRKLPRLQIPTSNTSLRRRSLPNLSTPSPTTSDHQEQFPKVPQRRVRLHRRMKALMRTKQASMSGDHDQDDLYAQTPILDLATPLANICAGWSAAELQAGRRLVRFSKVQDGRRLIVSCEPIRQEDYCEADSVISCIYREEADTCFVTSVDVIYLLERLTNGEFPVEEKNRIRRNLEGLRPTTVSKHKAGFGDFFQRIMEFPDPKPRNIEKDLKVFEWNLLGQALEKILSKYSIYTSPTPDHSDSPTEEVSSLESPELLALQLAYPAEDTSPRQYVDQRTRATKFEPTSDDFHFASTSSGPEVFASPIESPATASPSSSSSSAFPVFAHDTTHTESNATSAWTPDFKAGEMAVDNFSLLNPYDVGHPGPDNAFSDNTGMDFNIYENFTFHHIADDTLATLADHQYM